MIKIRCVVEHITYQNQENGYSVMKVKVKDYSDLVTLVGNLLDVPVGAVLLCNGDWKVDKRYGRQFVCGRPIHSLPAAEWGASPCKVGTRWQRNRPEQAGHY